MPIQPPSANLRGELARADLSQVAVADLLGLSQGQVSLRINGKVPWRVVELQKIARHLNVPVADLIDEVPAAPEPEPSDEPAESGSVVS